MTLEQIESIFNKLQEGSSSSLQLLKIKVSAKNKTSYSTCKVNLSPEGRLTHFVGEISDHYKKEFKKYHTVKEYDGSADAQTIYELPAENVLICDEFKTLQEAISKPDVEINPLKFSASAQLIKETLSINGEDYRIKLFSMQNPITTLRHKFWESSGTFSEIDNKVLSLRTNLDIIIIDDTAYMLSMAGEKLFNIERAYKGICLQKVAAVEKMRIVTDFELFRTCASSGHNPRRFVAFNDEHLKKLENSDDRRRLAEKFGLPLLEGKFDTTQNGVSEKLVKLLCNKGMVDPFDDLPMEVSSPRKWE